MTYVTLEGLNLLPSRSVMDEVSCLAHSRPPVRLCQIVMWGYIAPLQRKPWPGHLEQGLLPRRGQGKHQKNMKHLVVQRGGNVRQRDSLQHGQDNVSPEMRTWMCQESTPGQEGWKRKQQILSKILMKYMYLGGKRI